MTKFQAPAALLGLATDLVNKDWQPVWCPQRNSGSFSPEQGCTGGVPWMTILPQPLGAHKLAFRPPLDVLVIDVDHYDDKHGMDTMDRAVAWLGELPETYRVTSRGYANPSGRYMYRMPADLLVTDSSLAQFADEQGKTDVEIVRTGHRFSWAAGDYHYKNDELIVCYDEYGDPCDMPAVSDLPCLPEKWAAYFRNPPVPQKHEVYTRPSDGADWWLSQADASLGSDAELASFAYNMLLSRVPEDEIYEQWQRVAKADDPGWPWERKDFERHLGARAQYKADLVLAHQDQERSWFEGTGADLDRIAQQATEVFSNKQELRAVVDPAVPFNAEILHQIAAPAGIFFDPEDPDFYDEGSFSQSPRSIDQIIRSLPEYDRLLWTEVARGKAKSDAAKILAGDFLGYEDISQLAPPAPPSLLQVTGKNERSTSVVSEGTVTVLSAKRASGKTWVSALWAAQVMTAGGHVVWLDFERQPVLLNQKLKAVGIGGHVVAGQLHYSSKLPPVDRLLADIRDYKSSGRQVILVVDAFRTLQGVVVPGSNANDGDAVEQVYIEYLTPVVNAGASVVLLDHIAKNGDGSTFGSERKESAADYVIRLEKVEPFTQFRPGFASLTCAKDRYGLIAEGDPVGYLWVPGDKSKSGKSIEQYPFAPELRNWSPAEAAELDAVEVSVKARREAFLLGAVAARPLFYNQSTLADLAKVEEPELFDIGAASVRTNIINKLVQSGRMTADSAKKLDVPAAASPAGPVQGTSIDVSALHGEEDHQDNRED